MLLALYRIFGGAEGIRFHQSAKQKTIHEKNKNKKSWRRTRFKKEQAEDVSERRVPLYQHIHLRDSPICILPKLVFGSYETIYVERR